jgi:hypothetical protein
VQNPTVPTLFAQFIAHQVTRNPPEPFAKIPVWIIGIELSIGYHEGILGQIIHPTGFHTLGTNKHPQGSLMIPDQTCK